MPSQKRLDSGANSSSKVAYTKSKKKLSLLFLLILGIVFLVDFGSAVECGSTPTLLCNVTVPTTWSGLNSLTSLGNISINSSLTIYNSTLNITNFLLVNNVPANTLNITDSTLHSSNLDTWVIFKFANLTVTNSSFINVKQIGTSIGTTLQNLNFYKSFFNGSSSGAIVFNTNHYNSIDESSFYSIRGNTAAIRLISAIGINITNSLINGVTGGTTDAHGIQISGSNTNLINLTISNVNVDCVRNLIANNTYLSNITCINAFNYGFDFNNIAYNVLVENSLVLNSNQSAYAFSFGGLYNQNITSRNNRAINITNDTGFSFISCFDCYSYNDYSEGAKEALVIGQGTNRTFIYNFTAIRSRNALRIVSLNASYINNLSMRDVNYSIYYESTSISKDFVLENTDTQGVFNFFSSANSYILANFSFIDVNDYYLNITHATGLDFNLSKGNYAYFNNKGTASNTTFSFNSLNNVLAYYSNNSLVCSNLPNCDGTFNFLLYPLNYTFILNNFNLTEGTSRQFSPLWFSSSSSTQKTISSNLSQSINATVVVTSSISCSNARPVYKGALVTPTSCSGNRFTFDLENIPPGTSLLSLSEFSEDIANTCSTSINALGEFGMWIGLILVALGFFVILGLLFTGNIDEQMFVGGVATMVIVTIIIILGAIMIGSLC